MNATAAPQQERPRNRSECKGGFRPCPWVSCRYHLALDVASNGHVFLDPALAEDPAAYLENMAHTCALDVADEGPHYLHEIGAHLRGITREAARQTESAAIATLRAMRPLDAEGTEYDLNAINRALSERGARAKSKAERAREQELAELAEMVAARTTDDLETEAPPDRAIMDRAARTMMRNARSAAILRLRRLMVERELTRADVAALVGADPSTMRAFWQGAASGHWPLLSSALGVPLAHFSDYVPWIYAVKLRARLLASRPGTKQKET